MSAAGYQQDEIGELLGEEPQPIILLEPTSAPIPEFIPDAITAVRAGKSSPAWIGGWNTPDEAARIYAKLYYGILNNVMDAGVAQQEIERLIVADHDPRRGPIIVEQRILTLRDRVAMTAPVGLSAKPIVRGVD